MFLSGQGIYDNFTNGRGSADLVSGADVVAEVVSAYDERSDRIKKLLGKMDAAWKGDAAGAANRGVGPLAVEHALAAPTMDGMRDLVTRQAGSFDDAKNKVIPVPPAPEKVAPLAAFMNPGALVTYGQQLGAHNAAAQHNVDVMRGYEGASAYNMNMPESYGQLTDDQSEIRVAGQTQTPNGPGGGGTGSSGGGSGPNKPVVPGNGGDSGPGGGGGQGAGQGTGGPGGSSPGGNGPDSGGGSGPGVVPGGQGTSPGGFVPPSPPTVVPGGPGGGVPPGGQGLGFGGGGLPIVGGIPEGGGSGTRFGTGGPGGGGLRAGGPEAGGPRAGGPGAGGRAGVGPVGESVVGRTPSQGGAAGRGGASAMPFAPGVGKGRGGEDEEHERKSFLKEPDPEGVFGTDEITAPPVIGEEP